MKKLGIGLLLGTSIWSATAFGFEPFVVKEIQIEGLHRVSEETVYDYLPFQIGDELSQSSSDEIILVLYKTGFFSNISLVRKDQSLVIQVEERPVIGEITVSGNSDIKTKQMLDALKDAGFAEGRTFDRSLLKMMTNELERLYFSQGKYGVEVNITTENQPRQRVAVHIQIDEGEIARIRDINIIGNRLFSDKTLLNEFSLSASNWLSWFSRSNQYARQRLESDLESLRAFYLDRGYLNFDIISTQVSITEDKRGIYITINVDEGEQFTVGSLSVEGETVVPQNDIMKLIIAKPGETFSRRKIATSVTNIAERLGEEGYAFPEISPIPEVDAEKHTVSFVFSVDQGERYYVNKINFTGNDKTQESVLRQEMQQQEGAVLSSIKVDESKKRLDRTGFFQDVTVQTRPIGENWVDLDWSVEEAQSGHITGGVGYSTAEGVLFNASIANRNFMGTGRTVDLDFNRSSTYTTYSMGYNNPYYTLDGISRGFNLYYSETELAENTDVSDYVTDSLGFNVDYSLPLTRSARATWGFGVRDTDLKAGTQVPEEIAYFIRDNGKHSFEYDVSMGWMYNSLDRYIFPTKGTRHRVGASLTLPGSGLEYYKANFNSQLYYPFTTVLIGNLNLNVAYGGGYGNTGRLPFYQHYFAGGSRTVRGYEESSLGPKDSLGNPFGGNLMVSSSAQLAFSRLWGEENWKSVRPALFLDAGQVYATGKRLTTAAGENVSQNNPAGLRFTTGLAVTWVSPMGPLEFSLAKPLNEKKGDDTRSFSFSIGTYF